MFGVGVGSRSWASLVSRCYAILSCPVPLCFLLVLVSLSMASTTPVTRSVPSVHVRPVHLCRPVTICVHDTDCYAPSLLLRLRLRLRLLMSASFSQWCLIVHHHVPVGAGRTMLALGRYSTASTTMRLPHSSLPPFLPHGYCIPHHSSALCTLPHTLIAIHRVAPAPSDISPRTHLPQRRPPPVREPALPPELDRPHRRDL